MELRIDNGCPRATATAFIELELRVLFGESRKYQSRVGSKGELFLPKEIREKLGLRTHVKVIYKIEEGRLVVESIPNLEDVLKEPPSVEVTLEEFYGNRRELPRKAES
jgi:AbrB family looped-hinge helix DNA binding protein